MRSKSFQRFGYLAFGATAYLTFLVVIGYAVGFVGDFWHQLGWGGDLFRSVDRGGPPASTSDGLLIDVALLGLFAVQHSVMARPAFKRRWTALLPLPLERSVYVLAANACFALLFWQWRPLPGIVWDLSGSRFGVALLGLSLLGWVIALVATFLLDHLELFGLKQVYFATRNEPEKATGFRTPGLYRMVRHPLYFGFLLAFWATPVMSVGHLVFSVVMTAYVLVGIYFEERDLLRHFGSEYRAYRDRVPALLPIPRLSKRRTR